MLCVINKVFIKLYAVTALGAEDAAHSGHHIQVEEYTICKRPAGNLPSTSYSHYYPEGRGREGGKESLAREKHGELF
jgi:hypothetical protein